VTNVPLDLGAHEDASGYGKVQKKIHSECPQQCHKVSIQTTVVNIEECLKGTGDPVHMSIKNRQMIADMCLPQPAHSVLLHRH